MVKLFSITGKSISGEWGKEDDTGTGVPILRTTNFTNDGKIDFSNVVTRKLSKSNIKNKYLKPGDIIIEKSGGSDNQPVGRVVYFNDKPETYLFNNFTGLLRVKDTAKWNPQYVFWSLFANYRQGRTILYQNRTTGLHNLRTDAYIKDTNIYARNLCDQKKISDSLNKSKLIIEKQQKKLNKLDELVKARFVEMFGNYPNNEKSWPVGKIKDLVLDVRYGTSKKATDGTSGKYPYLRMNNITYDGNLNLSDLKTIDLPLEDLEKYTVQKGDLLFNRTNSRDLVGKTCVYDLDKTMVLAGFIIRVRLDTTVANPVFVSKFLNTGYSKLLLRTICKNASGQSNINAKEMQNIKIYVPPISLQNEFANFVQQVDKSKVAVQKSLEETQTLFDSLMQKYFG